MDKVKILRSKSQLSHSDGIVLALASVTGQDIAREVLKHGNISGLGVDKAWSDDGREKQSLLHAGVIRLDVAEAHGLHCKGFCLVAIRWDEGDPPYKMNCFSGTATTRPP